LTVFNRKHSRASGRQSLGHGHGELTLKKDKGKKSTSMLVASGRNQKCKTRKGTPILGSRGHKNIQVGSSGDKKRRYRTYLRRLK